MYYIKKPIPVEAVQLPKPFYESWIREEAPKWFVESILGGAAIKESEGFYIDTLEGRMLATWGNYIIKGIKGELYPCREDIFEETYMPLKGDGDEVE